MRSISHRLRIAAAAVLCLSALGAAQSPPAEGKKQPLRAFTIPSDDRKLGFTVPGEVVKVHIKLGDRVKAGQPLVELDDKEGEYTLLLGKLRIDSNLEVEAAQAQLDQARVEEKRLEGLAKDRAAANLEYERARVQAKIAALQLDLEKRKKEETRIQVESAEHRHALYTKKSPVAGLVETVVVREGETVEQLKPVVRLIVIDPFWVEVSVPIGDTLGLKVGDPAWITHDLAGNTEPMRGKIVFMAAVADSASGTRMVRLEVPNPENLLTGAVVSVVFKAPAGMASAPPEGHPEGRPDGLPAPERAAAKAGLATEGR